MGYQDIIDPFYIKARKEVGIGEIQLLAKEMKIYRLSIKELESIVNEYNNYIQKDKDIKKMLLRHMIISSMQRKKDKELIDICKELIDICSTKFDR